MRGRTLPQRSKQPSPADASQRKRKLFDWYGEKLGIQTQLDWYKVRGRDLKRFSGERRVPCRTDCSLFDALRIAYPEYTWDPLLSNKRLIIKDETLRETFDSFAEHLGIVQSEDWYKYSTRDVKNIGASSNLTQMLSVQNGDLSSVLKTVYPEYEWKDFLFQKGQLIPDKETMDWLSEQLGVHTQLDWSSVTQQQLAKCLGSDFTIGSLIEALKIVYPQFEWKNHLYDKDFFRNKANHRAFFDWIAEHLGIQLQGEWYFMSSEEVNSFGGRVLSYYNGSLLKALQAVYPEFTWNSLGFFDSELTSKSQREYFDWLSEVLHICKQTDWYRVSKRDVSKLGGAGMLSSMYKNSLCKALSTVYPEYEWNSFLFEHVHKPSFSHTKRRKMFDWIATQLGIEHQHDWYQFTLEDIKQLGINYIPERSLLKSLQTIYPEYLWIPLLFDRVPNYYWHSPENRRNAFDWLAEKLCIENQEDWYSVSVDKVHAVGGAAALHSFHNSVFKALQTVYPEYEWNPWLFIISQQHQLNSSHNPRQFYDWIAEQLGIANYEDWFQFTGNEMSAMLKGFEAHLFHRHQGSLLAALKSVYPEFQWNFWENIEHVTAFFDRIANSLNINTQSDWYDVTNEQIQQLGGTEIFHEYSHLKTAADDQLLFHLLELCYPQYVWFTLSNTQNQRMFIEDMCDRMGINSIQELSQHSKRTILTFGGKLANRLLNRHSGSWFKTLKTCFSEIEWPDALHSSTSQDYMHDMLIDMFGQEHKVLMNHKMKGVELDVYIPTLCLALEYQGAFHYHSDAQRHSDQLKVKMCESLGITLLHIPFWWKNSPTSLMSLLQHKRPDIQLKQSNSCTSNSSFTSSYERSKSHSMFAQHITLDDVRRAVEGVKDISECENGEMIVFDSVHSMQVHLSFPDPLTAADDHTKHMWMLRRECRGLKFNKHSKELLCRPIHKVWSVGEVSEAAESAIPLEMLTSITIKYDGVMVTPVKLKENSEVQFVRRNGDPCSVEELEAMRRGSNGDCQFEMLAVDMLTDGYTPVFEFCSPLNRNKIVHYPQHMLVLTAIRHNATGEYMQYKELNAVASKYNVTVAKEWESSATNWKQIRYFLNNTCNVEGLVLMCEDQRMFTLRTKWYSHHKQNALRRLFRQTCHQQE